MNVLKNIVFFVSLIFLTQMVFSAPSILSYEIVERTENTLSFNLTFSEEVTIEYNHSEDSTIESYDILTDNFILSYNDLTKDTEYTFYINITNSTGSSTINEITYKTDIYEIGSLVNHIFESNQDYTISQDQTISSLNLQNIENTTISCNNKIISSDLYNFSNTKNITFESCYMQLSQSGILEDTIDTEIRFKINSDSINNFVNIDFSQTIGTYIIDKKLKSFSLTKTNGDSIDNYDLNISSEKDSQIYNTYEYTQDDEINEIYYLYQNFSKYLNTTYDTIVFDISSINTASSSSISLSEENDVNGKDIEMQLEDLQTPYLISENFILRTNETLNFNLTFSEDVSYKYYFKNESGGVLKESSTDEKLISHNIFEEGLEPDTTYIFEFEIEDTLGYTNNFILEYKTFINENFVYEIVERTENTLSFNLTFREKVTIEYYRNDDPNTKSNDTLTDNFILSYNDLTKDTDYTFQIRITNSTGSSSDYEITYKTDIYDITTLEGHIFESNQNYTISQDQSYITSVNLQNIENTIISCNDKNISSDTYNFSNTKNVTFNHCIIDFPHNQVILEDTLDTYIKFKTDSYDVHFSTFNFSQTTGKYFIDKKLKSLV